MRNKRTFLTAVPLAILVALVSLQCSRDPVVIDATVAPVDRYVADDADLPVVADSCDCDDPMLNLRWLRYIVSNYQEDTIDHLAIFNTTDMSGNKRLLVAIYQQYPFDRVVLYNYCGQSLDTLAYTDAALVGAHIDPSALTCIYQNYSHLSEDGFCYVTNPLVDMPWLSYFVEVYKNAQVYGELYSCQYEYNEETHNGFLMNRCVNCSDTMLELYDCLGNNVATFIEGVDTLSDGYSVVDNSMILLYKNY